VSTWGDGRPGTLNDVATSRIADSVGRVLGDRYRLTRPLGMGASAHVFAAEDVQLRRRVAVKLLHPGLAAEEAFLRRFRREAQAVASLRHPNIVRVYDWGEDRGSPYLVMELLEGGSLRSMLDRGARLSPAQAASVGADAARALDYAHRQGLVHRDIKPANLLFDEEGRVTVADFGLARALAEAAWTEPVGAVVGMARYASPELVRGEHLDSKADVYSLALVLVEALTGTVPFVADTAFGTLMARVGRPLEVSDETGPLKPVLEAAGATDPASRLDAGALARALDGVSTKLPFPAPLSLGGPFEGGFVERDDISPTELPGRPKLFDRTEWEDDDAAAIVQPPPMPHLEAAEPNGAAGHDPTGDRIEAVREIGTERPHRRRRILLALLAGLLLLAAGVAVWVVKAGTLKPEEVVPNLVGESRSDALASLTKSHLGMVVTSSAYSTAQPLGNVLSQDQAVGSKLKEDSNVRVVLSLGPQPVPVPNLAHDTQAAAQQVLAGLGLKWTIATQPNMTVESGVVISNSPNTGTLVPGKSVALTVSSGKPQVAVPAITVNTESFNQARADLTRAGLKAQQDPQYSNTVAVGDVISVSPPPGTQVSVGSSVTVVVSKGPHYVNVPPTRNDSVGTADQILTAAGFTVSGVQGNPLNTVKGTNPPAGKQVLYGSSVEILTK
jgi:eukaryotic-like serine/threonine-protein kinase